jgi:hypothetical protein
VQFLEEFDDRGPQLEAREPESPLVVILRGSGVRDQGAEQEGRSGARARKAAYAFSVRRW